MPGSTGTSHGFSVPTTNATLGVNPKAQRLCDRMQQAWIAFARHGDPGHGGLPAWPAYTSEARSTMSFANECTLREDPHARGREIWEELIPVAHASWI